MYLKDRLNETCDLAQKELHKAQTRQAKYYNRNTKDRILQAGDEVLVLLPTDSQEQKLFMQIC